MEIDIYDAQPDDEHMAIEAWEKADADLAAQGLTVEQREAIWRSLQDDESVATQALIDQFKADNGMTDEQAMRAIYMMNGIEV